MSRRVIITSGTFRERADGVARALHQLSRSLNRAEIEHHVFAPIVDEVDPKERPYCNPYAVRSLTVPFYKDYKYAFPRRSLAQYYDSIKPDVIQISTPDTLGEFTLRYAKRRGVPTIAVYHTHFPSYLDYYHVGFLKRWMWRRFRRFYNEVDLVYAPTQAMQKTLAHHSIESVRLWERGIDHTIFNSDLRKNSLREQWGGDDKFYVAFVGRLVWYKGLDVYTKVYENLHRKYPNIRFVIIGDGPAGEEVRSRMPKGVFCGYLNGTNLGSAIASCDLMLFPSITETFGQVVQEGMACGLPVVVADQGGPADLVYRSGGGRVVRADDQSGFSAAVTDYYENREQLAESRRRGLKFARQRNWDCVNQVMIDAYNELIERYEMAGDRRPSLSHHQHSNQATPHRSLG